MIILHPLLLARGQDSVAYQFSIIAFLVFLSALLIDAMTHIAKFTIHEEESFVINFIKRNITIKISSVKPDDNVDIQKAKAIIKQLKALYNAKDTVIFTQNDIRKFINNIMGLISKTFVALSDLSLHVSRFVLKRYFHIIAVFLCILIYWKFGFIAAAFGLLLLSFVMNRWSSRIIVAFALVSLSACPFLLLYKQESLAEGFATYAYYFLTLATVLLIIEQARDREQYK